MKAKFVLAVLFLGHFIVANDGGEISDTQSECQGRQGANCVEIGASVNRRSVDGVGEKGLRSFTVKKKKGLHSFTLKKKKGFHSFTLKKKKSTHRKLHRKSHQKNYSLINIENRIHKAAHKKINRLLKTVKSQRKALRRQVKNGAASISHLVKMSCDELNANRDKINAGNKIVKSSFDEEMRFLNSSVKDLRKTIDKVAEDIKELIDKFWNEAMDVEASHIKAVCQGKENMEDLKHLIRQAAFCSSNHIKDLLNCGDSTIRGLASTSGHGAMELSTKNCAKFKSVPPMTDDEGRQARNMDRMCERLTQLSQLIADKLHNIAETCLQFLSKLTDNGIQALTLMADKLSDFADAECEGNDKKKAEIQASIQQIYHDMDHSRKEITKQMLDNQYGMIDQLYGNATTIVHGVDKCTLDKTC